MPAILAWLTSKIFLPLIEYVVALETPRLIKWIKSLFASQAQKEDIKEAVAAQAAAIESGDKDAIEKAGTDVLNGNRPK